MRGWKPLKVCSMVCSQKKPKTFMVMPVTQPSMAARRVVCRCMATMRGTQATNASGHTSMPANASQ
jgi:hypothetical protein